MISVSSVLASIINNINSHNEIYDHDYYIKTNIYFSPSDFDIYIH